MRIYGIDFSSAPSARKPITCALCRVQQDALYLDAICALESLECFHNLLASDGPWVAGMDFPFGLPRDFLAPLNWSLDWEAYVSSAGAMPRAEFRDLARAVAAWRTVGRRYSLREADRVAGAQSPMNVTRPPTGLMFHAGAPSLLASGATVLPMKAGDPQRTVVEVYPKLVARALIGERPYKDEASLAGVGVDLQSIGLLAGAAGESSEGVELAKARQPPSQRSLQPALHLGPIVGHRFQDSETPFGARCFMNPNI